MTRGYNRLFSHGLSLDPSQHRITVKDQQQHELIYDYLVYTLGSMTNRQSVPGVAEYAYSLQARGPFSADTLRETLPKKDPAR